MIQKDNYMFKKMIFVGIMISSLTIAYASYACNPSGCESCQTHNVNLQQEYLKCQLSCQEVQQAQRESCLAQERSEHDSCMQSCEQEKQECAERNNKPGSFVQCQVSCNCSTNHDHCINNHNVCECSQYVSVYCSDCDGCARRAD